MTELSPEDRQRIYNEERTRMEVREQLEKEAKEKKAKTNGIAALIVLCLFGYLGYHVWSGVGAAVQSISKPDTDLVIKGFDLKATSYGGAKIVGEIENTSQKAYRYAAVEFSLYDNSGAQVGTSMANTTNLDPGGKWKFEALVLQKGDLTARLKKITGY